MKTGENLRDLPSGSSPSESTRREGAAVRFPSSVAAAVVSSADVAGCCGMGAVIGCGCGGRTGVFGKTAGCGVTSTVFTGGGNGLGGSWTTGVLGGGNSGLGSVTVAIFADLGVVVGLGCRDGAKDGCVVVLASLTATATGCGIGAG